MTFAPLVNVPYLGDAVSQLDGSAYQYVNCVAAGSSVLANTSSVSFYQPTPSRIRVLSQDTSLGIDYPTAAEAVKKATNGEVVLTPVFWVPATTLDDVIDAGRITGISIKCSVTINTIYRTSPTYTGKHFIVVGAKRYATVTRPDGTKYQQKQGLVMDPGHSEAFLKWQWWPWSLIIAAAKASTGNDTIHLMYTRDLTRVTRTVKLNGRVFSAATNSSTVVGSVTAGTSKTVYATRRDGSYSANNHTCRGWSKIGDNQWVASNSIR